MRREEKTRTDSRDRDEYKRLYFPCQEWYLSPMDMDQIIAFWKKSAEMDKKTSDDLFKSKNYVGCLFFVHLYLEKTLKGLVQKETGKTPPYSHDLLILAKIAKLDITKEQEENLATINTFNIRARYADYKFAFYKKATKGFTTRFCIIAEDIYKWFLSRY